MQFAHGTPGVKTGKRPSRGRTPPCGNGEDDQYPESIGVPGYVDIKSESLYPRNEDMGKRNKEPP